jgi:tetratricopeptide (TPR) repeat protein
MRSHYFVVALLLFSVSRLNASELKGIVRLNELNGSPVSSVQITALQPHTPAVTHSNGTFTLIFPNKRPGDKVDVLVTKSGYKVVNWVQLGLNLPKDSDSEILSILLSKPGDVDRMALIFYRLKVDEAIEKNYRQRVADLKAQYQADKEELTRALARAEQERDQAKAASESATSELAKLKPEQMSETYQQAVSLYLNGKINDALAVLDEEKLRRAAEAAIRQKADAEQTMADTVRSYLLRADLLTIQFRFDAAEKAYQSAVELAPDSFDANFQQALFQQNLNHHAKSLPLYQHCL